MKTYVLRGPRFVLRPLPLAASLFGMMPVGLAHPQDAVTTMPAAPDAAVPDAAAPPGTPHDAESAGAGSTESAEAETSAPEPPVAGASDEIVVTATRRKTTVQDIPLNVSAIGGAEIERQNITDLAQLSHSVPGLFLVEQGSRDGNPIVVRGLNATSLQAGEGTGNSTGGVVSTYIGDIPLFLDLKLTDIERVEVLLGPQGTLYGAGTLGGAIRYIPMRPRTTERSLTFSQDLFALSHSAGMGSDTQVIGNLPLSDSVAVRGSVGYSYDPGYTDYDFLVRTPGVSNPEPDPSVPGDISANVKRKRDVDTEQTLHGRLGLLWQVTDMFRADLTWFYQDQDVGGRSISQHEAFDTGRYVSAQRYREPNDRKNNLGSLELNWQLPFATLTSATGLSHYDELGHRDQTDLLINFDYGYYDFPSFSAFTKETVDQDRISQEIRLVSNTEGPISWIGGLFYNDADTDSTSEEFTPGYEAFLAGCATDDRACVDSHTVDDLEYYQVDSETLKEMAAFGEVGVKFTDAWQVTVGARAFEFKDKLNEGIAFPLVDGSDHGEILPDFIRQHTKDKDVIFKFNTSYRFTADHLGYLTVSEGYRPGGINPLPLCPESPEDGQSACVPSSQQQFKPDKTTNYEIGLRTSWLGGDLILNGDVYYIDWKDVQVARNTDIGAVPITVNGAKARSTGLELTAVMRFLEHWKLSANYAYNNSELAKDSPGIIDGQTGGNTSEDAGNPDPVDGRKGDRLPGSPHHQGNVLLTYATQFGNGWRGDADYGVRGVSNVYTKIGAKNNGEALGGYVIHRASAGAAKGPFSFRLYADNLFDRYAETGVRNDRSFVRTINGADVLTDGETPDHVPDDPPNNGRGFRLRRYYHDTLEPMRVGVNFRYDFGG